MAYSSDKRIGFVSTRFAGNDGVSLESAKWAEILWEDKNVSHWYAGLLDRDPGVSFCVPEAHFADSENEWINRRIWGTNKRSRLVSHRIREVAEYLKSTLYKFVDQYDIDVLIPQNVLTIPMHVPFGIALTEFITETQIPTISHNHDFYWERDRFAINAVQDYLDMAFPPRSPAIRHAVINQQAQEQLSLRKGVSSLLIPNVFDFEEPPPGIDEYSRDARRELGLADDEIFILQPTRIVPRKGIEHAIKLVGLLNNPKCKLVISHEAGDEGFEYQNMLVELAREEGVDLRFISDRVSEYRHNDSKGRKMYTLWDLYPHADLVTYPSTYEGFGNAFLEALYFRVPIVVNRYSIFIQDIEPKGFRVPLISGFVTNRNVAEVRRVLEDHDYRREMVDYNYELARRFYSYSSVRNSLRTLLSNLIGMD